MFDKNVDPYKTYLCDYIYKGEKWSIEIQALSYKDAEDRMKAISKGEITGELVFSIPVVPVKSKTIGYLINRLKFFLRR